MAEPKPSADPTQALGGAGVLGKGTLSRQLILSTTALVAVIAILLSGLTALSMHRILEGQIDAQIINSASRFRGDAGDRGGAFGQPGGAGQQQGLLYYLQGCRRAHAAGHPDRLRRRPQRRGAQPAAPGPARERRRTQVSALELHSGEVAVPVRVPDADADPRSEVGQVGWRSTTCSTTSRARWRRGSARRRKVRQFVADASHELRNPLASIRGYAELTRRERARPARRPPPRAGTRIESESERMSRLVEDLLLLARLDSGPALAPPRSP
jgi:signal transduction histidine kinase